MAWPRPVRFIDAEADRAKGGGHVSGVKRALQRFRQHAFVDHVLDREEAGDVGLGFFLCAPDFFHLLSHGGLVPADGDVMRSKPVHEFVDEDVGEESVERQILLVCRTEHNFRNRHERLGELRVLHILEHDALRSLFASDAFIVRQIESGGLDTVVSVAGAVNFVHDDDRREGAELRVAVFRIDREMVLDVLQFAGKFPELGGFGFVLNSNECFKSGLVVEPAILINLVRADGRLDRTVQFHPRNVAGVVVV